MNGICSPNWFALPICLLIALIATGCGGGTSVDGGSGDFSSPEGAAQAYLEATRDGDSATACSLLAPDVLKRDYGSLENCEQTGFEGDVLGDFGSLELGRSVVEGDFASVEILDDGEHFTTYALEREGDRWLIGDARQAPELPK